MKIIYSGGCDKYSKESMQNSMFYRYAAALNSQIAKGMVVASINFAKPDSYYDSRLEELFQGKILSIDTRNQNLIDWSLYDVILMPGGSQRLLKDKLLETGFAINKLKKSVVVIGDSAGAYILAKYFPFYDGPVKELDIASVEKYIGDGFYPESNILIITHINNERYVPDEALTLVTHFANKLKAIPLLLKENEEMLLDEKGNLVQVDQTKLFV